LGNSGVVEEAFVSLKNTVLLLVLAALLVAVVIWVVAPGANRPKEIGAPLFAFDTDDIRGIQIINGSESFEIKRKESGWRVFSASCNDFASHDAIKELVLAAMGTVVLDRIPAGQTNEAHLAEYGLKKSQLQFDFKGDVDLPMLLGKEAADTSRMYIRFENANDVYLVNRNFERLLLRPATDYRDLSISQISPARIDRIVVRRGQSEMELRRDAHGWQIAKPLEARADEKAVGTFLMNLLQIRIEGFVPVDDSDPAAFGLAESRSEVRLFAEGENDPQKITLGAASPEGGIYARLAPRNVVCRLPKEIDSLLGADILSFRDLSLARVNLDLVDRIRVTSPAGQFVLVRKDARWEVGQGTNAKSVSADSVAKIVSLLTNTKVVRFSPATTGILQKAGLEKPQLRIEFLSYATENTPESLAGEQAVLGLSFGSSTEGGLVPTRADQSPEVAFVPGEILKQIPQDPATW